jgi:phage shock protein A
MAIMDAVINAMSELLIENKAMRQLLKERADLQETLRAAKADPENQRRVREMLAGLGTAISDEAAAERIMQRIAERSSDQGRHN